MTEKKLSIKGVEWEYATGGRMGARRAVLMFHGAIGGAEGVAWLADALAGECRTIAPTIAAVRRLDEVCDAASAILDREHVGRAIVFGGSFGGMIAQAFARRYPRQVERLILLSAGLPDPALGARNEKMVRIVSYLPFFLTRELMKLEITRHLDVPDAPPEVSERVRLVKERLKGYFDKQLTREVVLSRMALAADFCRNEFDSHTEFDGRAGRVLIIESTDDPMINAVERRRLREAYPGALVCTFEGAGDMIPILRTDELLGVMTAFVNEDYARPEELEHCPIHEEC